MSDAVSSRSDRVQDHVQAVAGRVQASFRSLLAECSDPPNGLPSPTEMRDRIGVEVSLGSRLLTALRLDDALAALPRMPKERGLRIVVKGASRLKPRPELLEAAGQAVDDLSQLVRTVGGQAEFDAMLAGWVPEAREKFELRNRQGAFRAMSNLKGVSADVVLSSHLVHPGANPEKHDAAWVLGWVGLQRLRADGEVRLTSSRVLETTYQEPDHATTLDGLPLDAEASSSALLEFCQPTPPQIRCVRQPTLLHRVIETPLIGRQSSSTVIFGEKKRASLPRRTTAERPLAGRFSIIDVPTPLLVLDFFVHEEVWRGEDPKLLVYDNSPVGVADPNDRMHDIYRWPTSERIQRLGDDAAGFGIAEIGRYTEVLRHTCDRLGWDLRRFRGYRVRMRYPVYATQVCVAFSPR